MSLRHAILGVLEFQPLHGYALKCVLEQGISQIWPVNLGAIYPSLHRLESEGLVTHQTEATGSGRPDRKVYSLTDTGREEMSAWRRLPPDLDSPRWKNPLFLKLLFARTENLRDVRDWVHKARESAQEQAAVLRDDLAKTGPSNPFFVGFMRETGLAHAELHIDRLGELLARVDAMIEGTAEHPAREFGIQV